MSETTSDDCHLDTFRFHRLEPVGLIKGYVVQCVRHDDRVLCPDERTLFCWVHEP